MLYESHPWKQDLLRRKYLITKYNSFEQFEKNSDAAYTVIEKAIFYSAFIIRKLIDCKSKLSDEADNYKFQVQARKPLKQIDLMHRWPESDSHDWENEISITINGREICNWLIHSYVFFTMEDEDVPVSHFCVSSDFDRNKYLYMISMDDWIKYIDFIGKDYVAEIDMHYDEKKKDFIFGKKTREK